LDADADAVASAGDPWRPRKLRTAVGDSLDNAHDIESWLRDNPPDNACYVGLQLAWTLYIDAYVDGLETLDYGLMEPITYADVNDGLQQLIDSVDLLNDVTAAMDATSCI
jgi:hypothetical protein